MGGQCKYFGKPHEEHFYACLRELNLDANRVAHVGDSLHHDIAGANAAGISNIFITGGIHSGYFENDTKDDDNVDLGLLQEDDDGSVVVPSRKELELLFEMEDGIVPTHVLPLFRF